MNHVELRCVGTTITATINGTRVAPPSRVTC
jgi:hypothetical protein